MACANKLDVAARTADCKVAVTIGDKAILMFNPESLGYLLLPKVRLVEIGGC